MIVVMIHDHSGDVGGVVVVVGGVVVGGGGGGGVHIFF